MGSLAAADGLSHPFEGEIGPSANGVSPGSKLGIEYGAWLPRQKIAWQRKRDKWKRSRIRRSRS